MSRSFEILGVVVQVEGAAADAVLRALGPTAAAAQRPPDLVLAAEPVGAPRPVPRPHVFVHRPLHAGLEGGAFVVGDEVAAFTIPAGGRRVDAELGPAAAGSELLGALHLPVALAFALRHHGVFHLHAAALDGGAGAVLVAGQSGVGKTTLAMALLEAGLSWLGDDAAYLAERGGAPLLAGVPRRFHPRPETLRAFPHVAACAEPPDASGRRALDPEAVWPGRRQGRALPPAALLFPEISRRPGTRTARLEPSDALGRLIEASALLVVDGAARSAEHLALLGRLAGSLPALRVELGEDLLQAPAEVARQVLGALAMGSPPLPSGERAGERGGQAGDGWTPPPPRATTASRAPAAPRQEGRDGERTDAGLDGHGDGLRPDGAGGGRLGR